MLDVPLLKFFYKVTIQQSRFFFIIDFQEAVSLIKIYIIYKDRDKLEERKPLDSLSFIDSADWGGVTTQNPAGSRMAKFRIEPSKYDHFASSYLSLEELQLYSFVVICFLSVLLPDHTSMDVDEFQTTGTESVSYPSIGVCARPLSCLNL